MDIFEDVNANPLEALVGDGKKFKTAEELAKGKIEADNYIEQLKQELASARSDLDERLDAEALLRQARNNAPVQAPPAQPPVVAPVAVDDDDLRSRIREIARSERETETATRNVETANTKVLEAFGNDIEKAKTYVQTKAQELGVSVDFLQDTAAKSPTGFLTLLGIAANAAAPNPSAASPSKGDLNTGALALNPSGLKAGTWAYWNEIRKTNPKYYNSPKASMQRHAEALQHGEAFFA